MRDIKDSKIWSEAKLGYAAVVQFFHLRFPVYAMISQKYQVKYIKIIISFSSLSKKNKLGVTATLVSCISLSLDLLVFVSTSENGNFQENVQTLRPLKCP